MFNITFVRVVYHERSHSPDREQPSEVEGPIEYVNLQVEHLSQVNEMLRRAFWDGIDGTALSTSYECNGGSNTN